MKTIETTVDPNGQARIETKEFSGGKCHEASRIVEQVCGTRSTENLTSDYYQGQATGQEQKPET